MAKRWYVVHAYSGYEKQVMRALHERIERFEMQDVFGDVLVPTEEVIDAVVATAEYIYDTFGKFPGTVPSIFVRYYTQAHRLETGFYDKYFKEGSYLDTHKRSVSRWLEKIRYRTSRI